MSEDIKKPVETAKPAEAVAKPAVKADAPKVEAKAEAKPAAAPKPAAAKKAAAPKKAAASKKAAAPKKAAPKKPAAKKAAPKAAAKPAAPKPETVVASSTELSQQISADFATFVQARIDNNLAFFNDVQNIQHPGELIKVQQAWMDDATKAYSDHFTAMNEKVQDMVTASFDPMLTSFKDAGEQWKKMLGV